MSKVRYKVERTFGSIRRGFNSSQARYRGMAKTHTHTQYLMEAMAYNLYRTPGIIRSCREKQGAKTALKGPVSGDSEPMQRQKLQKKNKYKISHRFATVSHR
ncbi:transposase [Pontibacter sp. E15-1]|uniref:transposase n=1 Tax=Pontibacter sp. E15-1 TaxID=2919918 RepID=UPI00397E2496